MVSITVLYLKGFLPDRS